MGRLGAWPTRAPGGFRTGSGSVFLGKARCKAARWAAPGWSTKGVSVPSCPPRPTGGQRGDLQPGKYPPSPSALVAATCLQRVCFWAQLQDKKQVVLCPTDTPAGPWHQAVKPSRRQNHGQHSLHPGRPPQNGGSGGVVASGTQPPSLGPLHLPTSLLPQSQHK